MLRRATQVVRFREIAVLGEDVILVHSGESVRDKNSFDNGSNWVSRSELHGRKIATSGGTPIGRIDDITLGDDGMMMDFTLIWTQVGGPIGDSRRTSIANLQSQTLSSAQIISTNRGSASREVDP